CQTKISLPDAQLPHQHVELCRADLGIFPQGSGRSRQRALLVHFRRRAGRQDGFIDLSDTAPGFRPDAQARGRQLQADPLMPHFPIIDTHLHVWDQTRLKYSAFEGSELFGHPYHVEDYRRDCGKLDIEAMVFLECYADFWEGGGQYIEEIEFVESEQKRDPRIKAIIPMAPVEWGKRVEPMLVKMRDEHPSVRGIRRIMEFDKDPRGLTLSAGFIEGVNL